MNQQEYMHNANAMIYLVSCALNGKTPKAELIAKMDLEQLFRVCQAHTLTACTAYALESAGIRDQRFSEAKEKAIRKNILFDAERRKVFRRLEEAEIWYMPLKGALLKDDYPKLGMRQMSDNDILFDGSRRQDVHDIFTDLGYKCGHYGRGKDDSYYMDPVYLFEMHNSLFNAVQTEAVYQYYENVKARLNKDENSAYGFHFTHEDFYLYILAHENQHFVVGGIGVRYLADTYVFLRKYENSLDWNYINAELEKLGIADFERKNRILAQKLFSREKLEPEEKQLLRYYVLSGTFGTKENTVRNTKQTEANGSTAVYLLKRLFPPLKYYKVWYPTAYRHKILLPAAWTFRLLRGLISKRKMLLHELKKL